MRSRYEDDVTRRARRPARRAHAGEGRARRERSARRSASACCTTSAASSRSRRSRFPRPERAKGRCASTIPPGRWPRTRFSMRPPCCARSTGIDIARLRSAHQHRRRRQHRRTVGRARDLPRTVLGADEDAAAAGRRGDRRSLDSRQGARRRRHRRETLCGAPGGDADGAASEAKTCANSIAAGRSEIADVASVDQVLRECAACPPPVESPGAGSIVRSATTYGTLSP